MSDLKDTGSDVPISTASSIDDSKEARFPPQSRATWALLADWNLCSKCHALLFKMKPGGFIKDLPRYIRTRRDEGCRFCGVLCEAAVWAGLWSDVRPGDKGYDDVSPFVAFAYATPVRRFPRLIFGEITHANPLSAEHVSFVRNQLNNCLSNPAHDCEPLMIANKARWPARVLRICDRSVNLVDFNTDVMSGQFAALSYCWGSASELESNPPYKATASTIQALRSGIDRSDLPATIQQALWVLRKLEIAYIWIDSLCIIQDSTQDWEVTIIAASSTSCRSGFLDIDRLYDQLQASLGSAFQLTVSSVCSSGFHEDNYVHHPHDPLDTRGWTLQEDVLSSRYIKFTKDDIQWKCNAGFACICGQQPIKSYSSIWQISSPTNPNSRPWEDLVEEFSHRLFTKDTDKLVSLSSLARKMASRFPALDVQTSYLAGLWRSSLINHLNWHAADELGRVSDSYVAPTFSWASLSFYRRGVGFSPLLKHVLCQVLDASTTPVYQGNQFGAVSQGTISLYGPHLYYTIEFQESKPKMTIRQEMTPELEVRHITLDCPLREHNLDDGDITLQRSKGPIQKETGDFSVSVLILGQSGPWPFAVFHCLILGYGDNGKHQRLGKAVLGYADRKAKFSADDFKSFTREVVLL
ncbi:hypothetical protein B0J15DRAFT_533646 [Fusarium solani]|uniref:Heterokaryon incompatibility domain-containing protein n=1 Tax=Fusarium solani TaxID=169388 RepID=A0A9P9KT54_FUSSL|nr:uncharacterized protein B0J15DRAFT_533646 [Fusarium solani]KAH7268022.1 hypothetical protein B0J15DRAFT_533646 [Fusarium solani]